MLGDFFLKKMLENQLKNFPEDQKEKIIEAFTENPEFFKKIAEEVQKEIASGKDQMSATMSVMQRHKEEAQKILGDFK